MFVFGRIPLCLHVDLGEAQTVLIDDAVHAAIAALAERVTCPGATAAVT